MAAASALAQLYSGPAWLGVSQYCERERASQAARSQRCAAARPPPSLVQYCFRVASPPPPGRPAPLPLKLRRLPIFFLDFDAKLVSGVGFRWGG